MTFLLVTIQNLKIRTVTVHHKALKQNRNHFVELQLNLAVLNMGYDKSPLCRMFFVFISFASIKV